MIYSYNEALKKYKTRYNLEKAINNNEIYRQDHGIYSDERIVNPIIIASLKYPNAILTMDSAFYYYNLTDVIPSKICLATNRNSDVINNDKITQFFVPKDKLNCGKTKVDMDGYLVNIYDKERLLVELMRKRKQISFDYYKEIIANYRNIVDELDMEKIETYLSLYKNDITIGNLLLREVF